MISVQVRRRGVERKFNYPLFNINYSLLKKNPRLNNEQLIVKSG